MLVDRGEVSSKVRRLHGVPYLRQHAIVLQEMNIESTSYEYEYILQLCFFYRHSNNLGTKEEPINKLDGDSNKGKND